MRITKLALLALVAERVYGYLDSSPFFLFSTSELLTPHAQLQSAKPLTSDIAQILSRCPSDIYVLVTQPSVSAQDYAFPATAPSLALRMTAGSETLIRSTASIADVVGEIDTARWQEVLEKTCGTTTIDIDQDMRSLSGMKGGKSILLKLALEMPSLEHPVQTLNRNDVLFASVLGQLPSRNYTVLYTTSPPSNMHGQTASEADNYEMETLLEEVMHLDLKRDVGSRPRQSSSNQTIIDGPLFEKYQFLSPGLFMGFVVGILLLLILYVAISGIAGMQVSYAAFDKESGQLAKKHTE